MDIVVAGAVHEQGARRERANVILRRAATVAFRILLRSPHEALRIDRVVEPPIRDGGNDERRLEHVAAARRGEKTHRPAETPAPDADPARVGPALTADPARGVDLILRFLDAELQLCRLAEIVAAPRRTAVVNDHHNVPLLRHTLVPEIASATPCVVHLWTRRPTVHVHQHRIPAGAVEVRRQNAIAVEYQAIWHRHLYELRLLRRRCDETLPERRVVLQDANHLHRRQCIQRRRGRLADGRMDVHRVAGIGADIEGVCTALRRDAFHGATNQRHPVDVALHGRRCSGNDVGPAVGFIHANHAEDVHPRLGELPTDAAVAVVKVKLPPATSVGEPEELALGRPYPAQSTVLDVHVRGVAVGHHEPPATTCRAQKHHVHGVLAARQPLHYE